MRSAAEGLSRGGKLNLYALGYQNLQTESQLVDLSFELYI